MGRDKEEDMLVSYPNRDLIQRAYEAFGRGDPLDSRMRHVLDLDPVPRSALPLLAMSNR